MTWRLTPATGHYYYGDMYRWEVTSKPTARLHPSGGFTHGPPRQWIQQETGYGDGPWEPMQHAWVLPGNLRLVSDDDLKLANATIRNLCKRVATLERRLRKQAGE
jgi:hypothetical protein